MTSIGPITMEDLGCIGPPLAKSLGKLNPNWPKSKEVAEGAGNLIFQLNSKSQQFSCLFSHEFKNVQNKIKWCKKKFFFRKITKKL